MRIRLTKSEIYVVVFTAIYLAIALLAAILLRSTEFMFYFVIVIVLAGLIWILHQRIRLPPVALWCLSIWGLAHMAGGLSPIPESWPRGAESAVLYNWWIIPGLLKFDQLVHAFGFGIVTWICWLSLVKIFSREDFRLTPTIGLLVLCVACGMGFGAANEVIEFAATRILPETNVGDYANTGWDLVSNLVGCLIAAGSIKLGFGTAR